MADSTAVPMTGRARRKRGPVLEVQVTESDGATLVRARGELDIATASRLHEVLAGQKGSVVLDLRGVGFIAAEGLHLLLEADARARQDGLELTVVPGEVTDRLLRVAGVRERFHIRPEPR